MGFEIEIIKGLQSVRNDFFDAFFNVFAYLGSLWAVAIIALLIFFLYNKKVGVAFAITQACSALSCLVLKHIIKRPRPFVVSSSILNIGGETGFSFPSGHLTATIVIAIFLFYMVFHAFKKKGQIVSSIFIVLYVLVMIVDRIYLGVHFLTDTFGGIALGMLWCAVALVALPPAGKIWDKCVASIKEKSKRRREQKQSQQNQSTDKK